MSSNLDIYMAFYQAMDEYPYYARGFSAFIPVKLADEDMPTFAIDKYWRLYYSDASLEKFQNNFPAVIRHELEHLLRDHANRIENRIPMIWNFACDAEINDDIPGKVGKNDSGVMTKLPPDCIMPDFFNKEEGLTAEEYYENASGSEDSPFKIVHEGPGGGLEDSGGEGSGVTNSPGKWELGENDAKAPSIDGPSGEELRNDIAGDVMNHAKSSPGSISSDIIVWAEARRAGKLPKISWKRSVIRRLCEIVKGKEDYSYSKMSRRNRNDSILLAGKIGYLPAVSVVVDTSGSMSSKDYGDWIAGCLHDLTKLKARVKVFACDSEVKMSKKLRDWRDVKALTGGGGTDMRRGIEKADGDLIVVLTDGETPWPQQWPKNLHAVIRENDGKVYVKTALKN